VKVRVKIGEFTYRTRKGYKTLSGITQVNPEDPEIKKAIDQGILEVIKEEKEGGST